MYIGPKCSISELKAFCVPFLKTEDDSPTSRSKQHSVLIRIQKQTQLNFRLYLLLRMVPGALGCNR